MDIFSVENNNYFLRQNHQDLHVISAETARQRVRGSLTITALCKSTYLLT